MTQLPLSSHKAFITGITGFVGRYLSEYLQKQGFTVAGLDRWPTCDLPGVTYFEGDLLDTATLTKMLSTIQPDRIFHLAGISFLPDADLSPRHALDINIMGSVSIIEAARQACPGARILMVGSSKEYSDAITDQIISEETLPSPTNFYGVSKFVGELIGLQYVRQYGTDIRFTRSFNHTGPGQPPRFVCSDWAKQVADIERGKAKPAIRVGDISPTIDFSDVRDVVRAYSLILEKGTKGTVYNVCSGAAISLKALLAMITAKTTKKITIIPEETRLRSHKTSIKITGDNRRLTNATGWKPEISLDQTINDLYDYWLKYSNNT